jgi:preprotein translocase SecE subunit
MLKFIKASIREFKHVVWPTHNETKKYFLIVFVLLSLFGLYLFIASTVFTEILFGIDDIINGEQVPNISIENTDVMSGETHIVDTEMEMETITETLSGTVAQ